MNVGNYEYVRIDVAVTLPCYPEDVEKTFERCKKFVEERLVLEKEGASR